MRELHSGQRGICSTIKGYIYDKYQPRWVPYHKRQVGQLQQEYRGMMSLRYQQVDHVRASIVVPLFLGTYRSTYQQWSCLHIDRSSSVSGNLSAVIMFAHQSWFLCFWKLISRLSFAPQMNLTVSPTDALTVKRTYWRTPVTMFAHWLWFLCFWKLISMLTMLTPWLQ